MTEPFPETRTENGYTVIKAVITVEPGFGTARGVCRFVRECFTYPGNVFVIAPGDDTEWSGKQMLGLLCIPSPPGTTLEFRVEGTDDEAARFARRLYSAVTSASVYDMDFDRFERKETADS